MSNKTCGECKYYCNDAAFCSHRGVGWKKKTDMICKEFEPIPKLTNGDVIRQGGNIELFIYWQKSKCSVCAFDGKDTCSQISSCLDGMMEWLNAPAESEENK